MVDRKNKKLTQGYLLKERKFGDKYEIVVCILPQHV
jgi:hypothetical protein